jgi:hypothetical protein
MGKPVLCLNIQTADWFKSVPQNKTHQFSRLYERPEELSTGLKGRNRVPIALNCITAHGDFIKKIQRQISIKIVRKLRIMPHRDVKSRFTDRPSQGQYGTEMSQAI